MMWILFIIAFPVLSTKNLQVLIAASNKTPPNLLEELKHIGEIVHIDVFGKSDVFQSETMNDLSLILDATFDRSYIRLFDSYSTENHIPYISLSIPNAESWHPGRYTLTSPASEQLIKLYNLLETLNWDEFSLLYSSDPHDIEFCDLIKKKDKSKVNSFISYAKDITLEYADNLIKTMVKAKGIRKLLIIDSGSSLETIQTAIKNRNLIKKENYFIFITEDIKIINIEGALIMTTQGQENFESYNLYIKTILENVINNVYNESQDSDFFDVFENLEKVYPDNILKNCTLVNVQNQTWVEVGIWNNNLEIIKNITYPGGIDYVSQGQTVTPIRFSIANGTSELTTNEVFQVAAYWYYGASYAALRSNLLQEIPNFMIELFPTDCGNMYYDPNLYMKCFEPIHDKLGVVYLTSGWASGAFGNAMTLKSYNHFIPQITPTVQYELLGNKTLFPELLKLTVSLTENISTALYLMRAFSWNAANLFFSDDPIHYYIYPYILAYLENIKYVVANSEDKRIFPKNYTRDDFEKYKSFFLEAKNNRCRIFFIYSINFGYILEGLYDVGLRKGDVVIISADGTVIDAINTDIEEKYLKKRVELIEQTFVHSYKGWTGELGERLYKEISKRILAVTYMCMTYDAVTVAKESVKYLITTGNDYEDLALVAKTMRNIKTIGCLGNIYFDKNSNNRESGLFQLKQILKNETTNIWFYQDLAVIDKYSSNTLHFSTDIVWATNDASYPNNYRPKLDCPFDPYLRSFSKPGLFILWCISSLIILITIIANYFSYKHFKSDVIPILQARPPTISDNIFICNIFFSFFQLISLSPSNTYFKNAFKNLFTILSFNLINYFDITFSPFWICIYFLLGFSIIWIFISIIISKNLHSNFSRFFIFDKFKAFSQMFSPIIANLSLIPIIAMFLEVYLCNEGIGNNLSDSFVSRDCTTFCYEGLHLKISIGVCIILGIYVGLIVYLRTMWEKIQTSLNLATKQIYTGLFSIIQVIIVLLEVNLRVFEVRYAGISVSCCIFVLFMITLKIQPFNYDRLNRIWLVLLGIALWHSVVSIIFLEKKNFSAWLLCEYLGVVVIILVGGYFIKKAPFLLKNKSSLNIARLLLFQFGKVDQKYALESNVSRVDFTQRNSIYTLREL
ncbi:hypothetical protein SteCoe_11759 [Stentor coeruleus]|uniref:Receptor ligand binding region domain-containing protein n=1 Tax=Stentor coeruleus TaxID=5963 RepID=A0A1R2CCG3_9CILI|nr:hypothetical protein SteCoe_11759 [Stentor coeruleus]